MQNETCAWGFYFDLVIQGLLALVIRASIQFCEQMFNMNHVAASFQEGESGYYVSVYGHTSMVSPDLDVLLSH